jgi:hypothetical protein
MFKVVFLLWLLLQIEKGYRFHWSYYDFDSTIVLNSHVVGYSQQVAPSWAYPGSKMGVLTLSTLGGEWVAFYEGEYACMGDDGCMQELKKRFRGVRVTRT